MKQIDERKRNDRWWLTVVADLLVIVSLLGQGCDATAVAEQ